MNGTGAGTYEPYDPSDDRMSMTTPARILVNAFDMNTPTHLVSGTWKHPDSQAWRYRDLGYWTELAALLERGLFDGLFIADVIGVYDVYAGGPEAALRAGAQIPVNDPMLLSRRWRT